MIVKLITEHQLEFLSLKVGCRGSSESTYIKMPHCWKSHALAHFILFLKDFIHEYGSGCEYDKRYLMVVIITFS